MEPGPLHQAQASGADDQSLWSKAPAWRNLVITASLLTTVALALPLMPEPAVKSAANPLQPRPHPVQTAALTLMPAPAKPVLTPAPTAPMPIVPVRPVMHIAVAKPVTAYVASNVPSAPQASPQPVAPQVATPQPAASATQLASAAPQTATPQSANEPATAADPSKVCLLTGPLTPHPQDVGRIITFEDRAMALARIQLTQNINHGQIDPAYIDNQRVHIDLGNGHIRVVLVPKGMTVSIGDVVMVQSGYRNMNLPCNYVPNLITSDLGPQGNRQPASQSPALQSLPSQTPPLQH